MDTATLVGTLNSRCARASRSTDRQHKEGGKTSPSKLGIQQDQVPFVP